MMVTSTTKTHASALLASSRDPRIIDQHGTIDGIFGEANDAFAGIPNLVINFGLIENTESHGIAVDLERNGIVLNVGTIEATGAGGLGVRIVSKLPAGSGAAVINTGTISGKLDGIDLSAGGLVINTVGGLIEGSGRYGIDVSGGPGTVINAGTVGGGSDGSGIAVLSGGLVTNSGVIQGGSGVVVGGVGLMLESAATLTNTGVITGGAGGAGYTEPGQYNFGGTGVSMTGGSATNSGTIAGGAGAGIHGGPTPGDGGDGFDLTDASLTNHGTIVGGEGGSATGQYGEGPGGGCGVGVIYGTLINSGVIQGGSGGFGFDIGGGAGCGVGLQKPGYQLGGLLLENSGTISGGYGGGAGPGRPEGSGGSGIELLSFGTIVNSGTINGISGGYEASGGTGIVLLEGGVVDNTGLIQGGASGKGVQDGQYDPQPGAGIYAYADSSMITNSGTILADGATAIDLRAGSHPNNAPRGVINVINTAGGVINSSGNTGIALSDGPATITDAGTISGTDAIAFSGSFADRVILDPGAVLNGTVIGGSGTNTLELAAGGFGSTGTVSSFGTEFTSFGTITLDANASWLLDGAAPAGQAVSLAGGNVLSLNDTAGFSDPISGFGNTDALDLRDVGYAAGAKATLSGSTLTVSSGGASDTLTLLGLKAGTTFQVGNDGAGHVLIDESVSPTAGHTAAAPLRFLAGSAAALPQGVFSTQASHAAMAESLQAFLRLPSASVAWSTDAAGGAGAAALHAMSASTSLATVGPSDRSAMHPGWLHHSS